MPRIGRWLDVSLNKPINNTLNMKTSIPLRAPFDHVPSALTGMGENNRSLSLVPNNPRNFNRPGEMTPLSELVRRNIEISAVRPGTLIDPFFPAVISEQTATITNVVSCEKVALDLNEQDNRIYFSKLSCDMSTNFAGLELNNRMNYNVAILNINFLTYNLASTREALFERQSTRILKLLRDVESCPIGKTDSSYFYWKKDIIEAIERDKNRQKGLSLQAVREAKIIQYNINSFDYNSYFNNRTSSYFHRFLLLQRVEPVEQQALDTHEIEEQVNQVGNAGRVLLNSNFDKAMGTFSSLNNNLNLPTKVFLGLSTVAVATFLVHHYVDDSFTSLVISSLKNLKNTCEEKFVAQGSKAITEMPKNK